MARHPLTIPSDVDLDRPCSIPLWSGRSVSHHRPARAVRTCCTEASKPPRPHERIRVDGGSAVHMARSELKTAGTPRRQPLPRSNRPAEARAEPRCRVPRVSASGSTGPTGCTGPKAPDRRGIALRSPRRPISGGSRSGPMPSEDSRCRPGPLGAARRWPAVSAYAQRRPRASPSPARSQCFQCGFRATLRAHRRGRAVYGG